MDLATIEKALADTLEDARISRSERRALRELVRPDSLDTRERRLLQSRAFELARQELIDPKSVAVLEWLEEALGALRPKAETGSAATAALAEAHFSPGDACWRRLAALLASAHKTADICVFTITDDRLSGAVLQAHRRGVRVRVITDDDKAHDLGSDVHDLARVGVPVRIDRSPAHMHHKFAIFDEQTLASGSYNWTRSAASKNEENLIVTGDRRLVGAFSTEFDRLWEAFAP